MGAICGFAGEGSDALLGGLLGLLEHRGRLGSARRSLGRVGLAYNVSSSPLSFERGDVSTSADGRVACVLDGRLLGSAALRDELASHGIETRTGAHAELVANLVMLQGDSAIERLDGAFAIALKVGPTLILARDALGEKPLYYTSRVPGTLLFASEIKAFFAHQGFTCEPDLDALNKLLVFSFVPGRGTLFDGVHELEPGHLLRVDPDGTRPTPTPYWDITERIEERGEPHFIARTAELTRAAVQKRLPADGRVGAFLSGGVDSSAVVALLADLGAAPLAYSVSFGQGLPNEIMYARMVAQHCHVEHRVIDVEPTKFLDLLPSILWSLDDPLCDCAAVPAYLLAREASRDVRALFTGEGGDPLFGGPKNKFLLLGEWYAFLGGHDRASAYLASYRRFHEHLEGLCTPDLLARTGGSRPLEDLVRPDLDDDRFTSLLNRLMRLNIKLEGGQNTLVMLDKMLSAHGVQAASPLFDRHLTELSFMIPPRYKRRGDIDKHVFKKAVEGLLPRPLIHRKKVGMGVPLSHWFRKTSLREFSFDLLTSQRAASRGYFRREFVERLLRGDGPPNTIGRDRSGELLWMLVVIELWHQVFVDGGWRAQP